MKTKLFVYGTLKRGFHNNRLLQDQKFLQEVETADPQVMECGGIPFLYNASRYLRETKKCYKAYYAPKVKGQLWEVDEEALQLIDGLEGHPRWYKRRNAIVKGINGNKTIFLAQAYYMTPPTIKEGFPVVQGEVRREF